MKMSDRPTRRLYGYLIRHWPGFALGAAVQVAADGLMLLVISWMLAGLTNAAVDRQLPALLSVMGKSLLGIWLISISLPLAARWRSQAVEQGIATLRQELFEHLQTLPIGYFERVHSGDTVARLTNDITTAKEAVGETLVKFIGAIFTGLLCTSAMWWINWKLALFGLLLGVIPLWVNQRTGPALQRANTAVQQSGAELNSRLKDILSGFRVVKAFSLERHMEQAYDQANQRARENELERVTWQTVVTGFNDLFANASFLLLMVLAGYLMVRREINPGQAIASVQLIQGVQRPFTVLGDLWVRLQSARSAAVRVFAVMDLPNEQWPQTSGPRLEDGTMVSLQQVSFAYEGKAVLHELSLEVGRGQVVALVGPSGGGKSTILKLLLGFYQPHRGTIRIAGAQLTDYTADQLRQQMAYVPQEAYLYAGTVYDNIAYGKEGASETEVYAAARAANAHDFILQLSDGYQTQVGERGAQLSGGQRQRIAIARAILKDAPLLLLDEATSSLDSESERLVQEALENLMIGRTTLVIAHRLSTIRQADCIHVVADGQIVESGNHEQLMAENTLYRRLNQIQVGSVA